jgi:hypothetical protein
MESEAPPVPTLLAQVTLLWALGVYLPTLRLAEGLDLYVVLMHLDRVDLGLLLGGLGLLPLLGFLVVARRLGARGRERLQRLGLAPLLALVAALGVSGSGAPTPGAWLVAVALLMALGPWLRGFPAGKWGAGVVAGLAILGALVATWRSPLQDAVARVSAVPVSGPGLDQDRPVAILVFDAFPVHYLLDCDGSLDAESFPNFARLAATSDWFRRTTTVHPFTLAAVPAMLSGRFPERFRYPTPQEYPGTLFSLLAATHRIVAFEDVTNLAPPGGHDPGVGRGARLGAVMGDLGVVLPHVLAGRTRPEELEEAVPDLAVFAERGGTGVTAESGSAGRFARFRAQLDPAKPRSLYFFHSWLPHSPWSLLEDGTPYPPFHVRAVRAEPPGPGRRFVSYAWEDDARRIDQARQRTMLQARYADQLLGEWIDALEAAGLWDEALVVVTSDHGTRYGPGEPLRRFADDKGVVAPGAPEQVLPVPLFVKRPGQRSGAVKDQPVLTVDLVPSIAAELGIPVPWPHQGRPWTAGTPPREEGPRPVWDTGFRRHDISLEWSRVERLACAARGRFADPGEGAATVSRWYRPRPLGSMVGAPAPPARPQPAPARARFERWGRGVVRVLSGELELPAERRPERIELVVVAQGQVIATTTASQATPTGLKFLALIPPELAPDPSVTLQLGIPSDGPEGRGLLLVPQARSGS